MHWRGYSDGSYQLSEMPDDDTPVGSRVLVRGRRDAAHWLARETVVALAADFGSLLPVDVAVEMPVGDGTTWRRVTEPELPWRRDYVDAEERTAALARYCEATLGFTPLAHLDLDVPLAGLTGVAFVLPTAASPTSGGAHRVYVKRMLLGARVDGILPEWAFFVRCVLDSSGLRPTASREQLYDDDVLLGTREALGRAVHKWLTEMLSKPVGVRRQFLDAHHLAVRALALTDDTMLATAATVLPFETTDGVTTIQDVADSFGQVLYTPNVEEYRRVAPVARAQGLTVVNAGYVYDADLLSRLAVRRPDWKVRALSTDDVRQVLAPIDPAMELTWLDALTACTRTLAGQDVEVVVRRFEPDELPAVLLHDRESDHQRDLKRISKTKDVWGVSLSSLARPAAARQLVLNAANTIVARLLSAPPGPVRDAGIQSVYVSAILLSGEPLRSRETDLMTRSLSVLLESGSALARPNRGQPGEQGGEVVSRSVYRANKAISRISDMPYGLARTQAAEQEARRIEEEGPYGALAYALSTLVDSMFWSGEVEKSFVPFTRMVRWWDEHPEHFDSSDRHSLFWMFKWMVADLMEFPMVPAEQIEATIADMERRLQHRGLRHERGHAPAVHMGRGTLVRRRGRRIRCLVHDPTGCLLAVRVVRARRPRRVPGPSRAHG